MSIKQVTQPMDCIGGKLFKLTIPLKVTRALDEPHKFTLKVAGRKLTADESYWFQNVNENEVVINLVTEPQDKTSVTASWQWVDLDDLEPDLDEETQMSEDATSSTSTVDLDDELG